MFSFRLFLLPLLSTRLTNISGGERKKRIRNTSEQFLRMVSFTIEWSRVSVSCLPKWYYRSNSIVNPIKEQRTKERRAKTTKNITISREGCLSMKCTFFYCKPFSLLSFRMSDQYSFKIFFPSLILLLIIINIIIIYNSTL